MEVRDASALDFETLSEYSLRIAVTDSGVPPLSDSIDVTVAVNDVNEAPVFPMGQTREVVENSGVGTSVGDPLDITDPDTGDVMTFSLSDAGHSGQFSIDSNGQLVVAGGLNFEAKPRFELSVTAKDSQDKATTRVVVVSLLNPPSFPGRRSGSR